MLPTLIPEKRSCAYSARDIRPWPARRSLFLQVLQDIARVLGLPFNRDPLAVLDLHDVERQVADVVLGGERPGRRHHADPVTAQRFESGDEPVDSEVTARPLESLRDRVGVAIAQQ